MPGLNTRLRCIGSMFGLCVKACDSHKKSLRFVLGLASERFGVGNKGVGIPMARREFCCAS